MGVADGQAVSAAVTNPAFLDANADDTAIGNITLAEPSSPTVNKIQQQTNAIGSFTGTPANSAFNVKPTWTNNDVGVSTDDLKLRVDELTQKFNNILGHAHDGSPGNGAPIAIPSASVTTVSGSAGGPNLITAGGGISFSGSFWINVTFVAGNGGPVTITANPQIAPGGMVGQILILVGKDDTNTVTLNNGTGIFQNGTKTLFNNSTIRYFWDGSVWVEIT